MNHLLSQLTAGLTGSLVVRRGRGAPGIPTSSGPSKMGTHDEPEIGLITASTLLAETFGLAVFVHPKQLAAYVGIAPAPYQSGTFPGHARISKLGNPRLRQVLYLAAISAVKTDSPLRDFYQRLLAKWKLKKVALITVARKLLTLAFMLAKTQRPYDHGLRGFRSARPVVWLSGYRPAPLKSRTSLSGLA